MRRFRDIFATQPNDRPEGGGTGRSWKRRSGNTKKIDTVDLHPQSHLGVGSSDRESAPPTLRKSEPEGMDSGELIQFQSVLTCLRTTGNTTSEVPAVSGRHLSVPNIDENKPVEPSSYVVDPSAAYENNSNWKSTAYASAKVIIDVVKESSDVFTPLKSVAGGLSAVLKHYDARIPIFIKPSTLFIIKLASAGEPSNDRIINTPG